MNENEAPSLAILAERQNQMRKDISDIKTMLEKNYVTQEQFKPISWFVWGLMGISLSGIAYAVINLIIRPT